jgi:tripartite-type tricarboxylate transporter receptor subunit TctC
MRSGVVSAVFWALCFASQAFAQPYPSRPIRLIVPNPPGGGVDILARSIGQPLAERLGQAVVVENRAGAGGTIGLAAVAKAPPDGYTLGMGVDATLAIAPAVYRSLPYDPVTDFAPVTLIATVPLVLTVNPSLPVQSVKDLIALAKARPGKMDYSSGGNATPPHLAGEVFNSMAGVKLNHVPYKGGPPAITAVVAGEVSLMFANMLPGLPHIHSGRLRAIAVTSERRTPVLPDVPTIAESGLPGYDISQWYGFVAPAGTPAAVVTRLYREIRQVLDLPDVSARLKAEGAEISATSPDEFSTFIRAQITRWQKAVKESGTRMD